MAELEKDDQAEELNEKENAGKKEKHRSPMNPIQIFFLNAFIIVLILWLMFGCICGLITAPNNDMYPHIKTSDLLLYYRFDEDIKAQDVVVLKKNGTRYVGRVVACSGDTVEITDQETLVINGNIMTESNIFYSTPRLEGFAEYPVTLEKDEFFILCDSRSGAEDSRYYGIVKDDEILGTVISVLRRNNL